MHSGLWLIVLFFIGLAILSRRRHDQRPSQAWFFLATAFSIIGILGTDYELPYRIFSLVVSAICLLIALRARDNTARTVKRAFYWYAFLSLAITVAFLFFFIRTPTWHKELLLGNQDTAIRLLEKSPELINKRDSSGSFPIHLAATGCHVGVVAFLVSRHADLDVADDDDRTALHRAAQSGSYLTGSERAECTKVIRILIQGGAFVNKLDKKGKTALWHALLGPLTGSECYLDAVKLLTDAGVVANIADLDQALSKGESVACVGTVSLLLEKAVKLDSGQYSALLKRVRPGSELHKLLESTMHSAKH